MKLGKKQSSNVEDMARNFGKGSPFAYAAKATADRMPDRVTVPKTPFNAAMEKAAKSDRVKSAFKRGEEATWINEFSGAPAPKRGRATPFDAKKARDVK